MSKDSDHDAQFRALLLRISQSHRDGKPTIEELKSQLTEARNHFTEFTTSKIHEITLSVLLDRLKQGDRHHEISSLALVFWWYFQNPDQAVDAYSIAGGTKPHAIQN